MLLEVLVSLVSSQLSSFNPGLATSEKRLASYRTNCCWLSAGPISALRILLWLGSLYVNKCKCAKTLELFLARDLLTASPCKQRSFVYNLRSTTVGPNGKFQSDISNKAGPRKESRQIEINLCWLIGATSVPHQLTGSRIHSCEES